MPRERSYKPIPKPSSANPSPAAQHIHERLDKCNRKLQEVVEASNPEQVRYVDYPGTRSCRIYEKNAESDCIKESRRLVREQDREHERQREQERELEKESLREREQGRGREHVAAMPLTSPPRVRSIPVNYMPIVEESPAPNRSESVSAAARRSARERSPSVTDQRRRRPRLGLRSFLGRMSRFNGSQETLGSFACQSALRIEAGRPPVSRRKE